MRFAAGDEVQVTTGRNNAEYRGVRGKIYSVNSHVTAPFVYGVKLYLADRIEYRAFNDDELDPHEESSAVANPSHYTWLPKGLEVIDLAEHLNFSRGSAVKYLFRAGRKDAAAELEDLEKARWYLNREIYRVKAAQGAH